MPTAVTHALVGLVATRLAAPRGAPARLWVLAPVVSVLPDADALGFAIGLADHTWSHRGFSHSVAFAALTCLLVVGAAFRGGAPRLGWGRLRVWAFLAAVMASHGLLDGFTDGGQGIELLWPFSHHRTFWAVRPIAVAPLRLGPFFGARGLLVLESEVLYVWIPLLTLLALTELSRRRRP